LCVGRAAPLGRFVSNPAGRISAFLVNQTFRKPEAHIANY
jgi:hypothetical protein